jgi:hypothetical protein
MGVRRIHNPPHESRFFSVKPYAPCPVSVAAARCPPAAIPRNGPGSQDIIIDAGASESVSRVTFLSYTLNFHHVNAFLPFRTRPARANLRVPPALRFLQRVGLLRPKSTFLFLVMTTGESRLSRLAAERS